MARRYWAFIATVVALSLQTSLAQEDGKKPRRTLDGVIKSGGHEFEVGGPLSQQFRSRPKLSPTCVKLTPEQTTDCNARRATFLLNCRAEPSKSECSAFNGSVCVSACR